MRWAVLALTLTVLGCNDADKGQQVAAPPKSERDTSDPMRALIGGWKRGNTTYFFSPDGKHFFVNESTGDQYLGWTWTATASNQKKRTLSITRKDDSDPDGTYGEWDISFAEDYGAIEVRNVFFRNRTAVPNSVFRARYEYVPLSLK